MLTKVKTKNESMKSKCNKKSQHIEFTKTQ